MDSASAEKRETRKFIFHKLYSSMVQHSATLHAGEWRSMKKREKASCFRVFRFENNFEEMACGLLRVLFGKCFTTESEFRSLFSAVHPKHANALHLLRNRKVPWMLVKAKTECQQQCRLASRTRNPFDDAAHRAYVSWYWIMDDSLCVAMYRWTKSTECVCVCTAPRCYRYCMDVMYASSRNFINYEFDLYLSVISNLCTLCIRPIRPIRLGHRVEPSAFPTIRRLCGLAK